MMINDGANPLAEVALALAMAFFSLMILMLFAMVNAPKADATDVGPATMEMAVESRDPPPDNEERHLVIFTDGGFFDEDLNRLDPAAIDPAQPVILAVSQQMPISRITGFQRRYPDLTIEIAELTPDWEERIAGMGREAGQ
ncbi:MAG: hypothetical protein VX698_02485 [Pseudomonadota bacterium]|nr:hypothetical protein [Pseudomonadota bacterium]MEC7485792.1 hypothetical protein [Pseudomonadota bacterium]MEC7983478.1 hypothetical protein [Pseudomonadota bacterium]MEC8712045.1 hypothetical protein [Pseudomonadota bacterium]MEC8806314.1 hypothetical protein [Pseudomonadota bacterium]